MKEKASISYNKLRQTIGWLGILLPIIVYLDTLWVGDCGRLQDSISHYYYTVANSFFVGILWGLGLVLLFYPSYKNDSKLDGILTNIAGVLSICVSLFPTTPINDGSCAVFSWSDNTLREVIHFASAGIMLAIFYYMSIFIFTKTYAGNDLKGAENRWKRNRNLLYKINGILTMLSIAFIGIIAYFKLPVTRNYTFWLEVTALLPFGISWIVKGGFIMTDTDEESSMQFISRKMTQK